jgi:site-specific recombinase XerD
MSRPLEPYTIPRRWDSKTFQITLNCSSGLLWKTCREWRRRSFQDFPFVFSFKDGRHLHASWIKRRFPEWLKRAGIELGGRKIVPHSSRHSLVSLLEERGVYLRYIQEMLGHFDLKTTSRQSILRK